MRITLREGQRGLAAPAGAAPLRACVRFCTRRSDFKDLGSFFCNGTSSSTVSGPLPSPEQDYGQNDYFCQ
jgi:hypothetical protein